MQWLGLQPLLWLIFLEIKTRVLWTFVIFWCVSLYMEVFGDIGLCFILLYAKDSVFPAKLD